MALISPVCNAWTRAELSAIGRMITWASLAFGPQYWSFLCRTTFSLIVQPANLNGPVPVGCWNAYDPVGRNAPLEIVAESASYFFSAVGLCIANACSASDGRNGPFGEFSVMIAVLAPFALQLL